MTPVHIIGTGLHTSLGATTNECLSALRNGDATATAGNSLSVLSCHLPKNEINIPYYLLANAPARDVQYRFNDVLFGVIAQAITAANLSDDELNNIGVFVGSSSFEIADEEERFKNSLDVLDESDNFPLAECGMGNLSERIRKHFNINGPDFTFNTACTSSANAMLYASQLINQGVIEQALVIAVEFSNDTTTYGFYGLQLLSQNALLPFDDKRDGLVLGESCAAAVLCGEKTFNKKITTSNEAPNYSIRLLGGANLCDTHSMSITHEDGDVVSQVIASALKNASLFPKDISVIKCHGTATLGGDAAEANGMKRAFESVSDFPLCTTIKPHIGHTLGACGLSEFILLCCAAQQGFIPATKGIAESGNQLEITLNQEIKAPPHGAYLLNYFGFGGNNTSLVADLYSGDSHD